MQVFGRNLKARAEQLGLSNAEVARRAELSERRYGNYVTGIREPDLQTLLRISHVLQLSIDELLSNKTLASTREKERDTMRLVSLLKTLNDEDFLLMVSQIEALAAHRLKSSKLKKST